MSTYIIRAWLHNGTVAGEIAVGAKVLEAKVRQITRFGIRQDAGSARQVHFLPHTIEYIEIIERAPQPQED